MYQLVRLAHTGGMDTETILRVSTRDAPRWDGTDEITSEAIGVACPSCPAQAEELCRNSFTGRPTRIPHPRRHRRALGLDVPPEPPTLGS